MLSSLWSLTIWSNLLWSCKFPVFCRMCLGLTILRTTFLFVLKIVFLWSFISCTFCSLTRPWWRAPGDYGGRPPTSLHLHQPISASHPPSHTTVASPSHHAQQKCGPSRSPMGQWGGSKSKVVGWGPQFWDQSKLALYLTPPGDIHTQSQSIHTLYTTMVLHASEMAFYAPFLYQCHISYIS